tara:strand:- start:78 stop:809 length:732 start_codon:yes stop_codon:yes gene_type:complete
MAFKLKSGNKIPSFKMIGSSPLTNLGHEKAKEPHTAPDGSEHTGGDWKITSKSTSTKGGTRTFHTDTNTGASDKKVVDADDTTVNNELLGDDREKNADVKVKKVQEDKKPYDPMNDACSEEYIAENGKDACDKYTKKRNKPIDVDLLKPLPLSEIPNEYRTEPRIQSNRRLDKPRVKESSKTNPDNSTIEMAPTESTTEAHAKIPKPGKPARTKTMRKNRCRWIWKDHSGGGGGWEQTCGAYG